MNDDNLDTLSDIQLDELFAREIVGATELDTNDLDGELMMCVNGKWQARGQWAGSADGVLPYLNRHGWSACSVGVSGSDPAFPDVIIKVYRPFAAEPATAFGRFSRAAVIALIRSARRLGTI